MLKIDRRLIAHFDWPLLFAVVALVSVGLLAVLSATHTEERLVSGIFLRQLAWVAVGSMVMLVMVSFDYHALDRYAPLVYVFGLVLLSLVPFFGSLGGGAKRWLSVGPFSLQPSEIMKLAVVVTLASYLHSRVSERSLPTASVLFAGLIAAIPAGMILRQPDLGTALVIVFLTATILLVAGASWWWPVGAVVLGSPVLPLLWSHLKPYQQRRLLMFLNPELDPLGSGYHIIQSKIAIGSGMWSGKGFLHGTQYRLNFLPEQHTDFIFSVFAEEWGFVGACVLLGLYLFLLYRCSTVVARARDTFGVLLAFGITAMLFVQVLTNIAMAAGGLPVVGVTLPFLSYGGSSMLVCMAGVGVLLNISMRRFLF